MSGLSRWQSLRAALAGLMFVLRTQRNAHIELAATALVVALAVWLRVSALEGALLALAIGVVFVAEMINTAIEQAIDLVMPEQHQLAGVAKDAAAAGSLVAALTAFVVGVFIFGPRLWLLIAR
jgi:diacylglycerol kinase (ATP)